MFFCMMKIINLLWKGQMEESASIKTNEEMTLIAKVNGYFGKPSIVGQTRRYFNCRC